MNGMEKIQARIAEDAKAEIAKMEAEIKEEVQNIEVQSALYMIEYSTAQNQKAEKAADEREARLISSAEMEGRKMELAMKQEVITQAFDQALTDLCSRPENEYVDLLVSLALASVQSGTEQMVFSEKDKDTVGKKVVAKVNEAISGGKAPELPAAITDSKAGPFLEKVVKAVSAVLKSDSNASATGVTLAQETRPMAGGFIMVDNDVEINCDFDTLVRLQRNELELEVANMLFS